MEFNEWMAYIYRMNGHPEFKIRTYEQTWKHQANIQDNQRRVDEGGSIAPCREGENITIAKGNQRRVV